MYVISPQRPERSHRGRRASVPCLFSAYIQFCDNEHRATITRVRRMNNFYGSQRYLYLQLRRRRSIVNVTIERDGRRCDFMRNNIIRNKLLRSPAIYRTNHVLARASRSLNRRIALIIALYEYTFT